MPCSIILHVSSIGIIKKLLESTKNGEIMKRVITIVLTLTVFSFLLIWFAFPSSMSRLLLSINNTSAGLSAKTVQTKLGNIHYLEGGKGETVILLHGIYARKEHWVDLARDLSANFHIIALDLPGFGDNQSQSIEQYELQAQAINLNIVLEALEIEVAHFGANSMGAQVAAILAAKRPELMRTLAFIGSPLGVPTVIQSDMDKALNNGNFPLLVKTEMEFENRNTWLFPETPAIPGPIMKTWMQKELIDSVKNEQIWHAANDFSNTPKLLNIAPSLNMGTLIIWCQEDRIFHVSGADLLDQALPKSRVALLDDCGHVPMLDKPKEVSQIYKSFLENYATF
jgi:pimeloyl-ACP methyl ester carboxylesterase